MPMRGLPGRPGRSGVDVPAAKGRYRFGNVVLSRLPIGRILRHSLPWPADPDVPSMPRVAVEAVVEAPFGLLRVITTHLEYYSSAQRAAQVSHLVALHAEATGGQHVTDAGVDHSNPSRARRARSCAATST